MFGWLFFVKGMIGGGIDCVLNKFDCFKVFWYVFVFIISWFMLLIIDWGFGYGWGGCFFFDWFILKLVCGFDEWCCEEELFFFFEL